MDMEVLERGGSYSKTAPFGVRDDGFSSLPGKGQQQLVVMICRRTFHSSERYNGDFTRLALSVNFWVTRMVDLGNAI